MSQVGKLHKFYFGKIWQKNWLRILIFTILIGIVWWFVIPFVGSKVLAKITSGQVNSDEEQAEFEEETKFSNLAGVFFGNEIKLKKGEGKIIELAHLEVRDFLMKEAKGKEKGKPEEGGKRRRTRGGNKSMIKMGAHMFDSFNYFGLSFPFTADNVFFFQQTDGEPTYPNQNYTERKAFWKLLFDIAWWNLTGFVVLYWFIFEVFDKTFFSPREDGEEATVLTMTPGVRRSDIVWGKVLAFLTFYFLINIALFLIPYGIYYFWLSPTANISWFSCLALIAVVVAPLLFFGLIFATYLFLSSLVGGGKWILSTLICFFPLLWGALKTFTSWGWPYTVERTFFDPVWFAIISLVCGIFFLALYYFRYQEEDLN